jgi:hypothetical protein
MTAKTELSAPKRRTRAEVQQLVAEFVSGGMRRSEFCHKLKVPVRDYFSVILPGLADISRSGASQTLLPLCGSPGIHEPERLGV